MSRSPSRFGAPWLVWKFISASVGASITTAAIIFAVATGTTAVPRAVENVLTSSLHHDLNALPPSERDLVSREQGIVKTGPSQHPGDNTLPADYDSVWGRWDDALTRIRKELPPNIRKYTGPQSFNVMMPSSPSSPVDDKAPNPKSEVILGVDPRLADHVRIVTGHKPGPIAKDLPEPQTIPVLVSAEIARQMKWPLGQKRIIATNYIPPMTLQLTGTFDAKDPDDPYWQQTIGALDPSLRQEGDTVIRIGVAWVDPASWNRVQPVAFGAEVHSWFPLRTDRLRSADSVGFATAIRAFSRVSHTVIKGSTSDDYENAGDRSLITAVSFRSASTEAISQHTLTAATLLAMIAMVGSGPLGIMLAVVVLGAGLVRDRRSGSLNIAAARGASTGQIRAVLAAEGLAIGLPAAILGVVAGILIAPGPVGLTLILTAPVVGLIPAALLAGSPEVTGERHTRADLGSPSRLRRRWVLETLVVVGAIVAVLLLHQRGFTAGADSAGVDPLLAATPLLLTLAVCVVVLRLYPLWVAWLVSLMRRRRGAVGLIGAARALRDPAAGLAAILAVVAGLSIAVFSGVSLSTIENGIDDTARSQVGADALIRTDSLRPAQVDRIRRLPGIKAIAPVYDEFSTALAVGSNRSYVVALVVDGAELRAVQGDVPWAVSPPASFTGAGRGPIPVIASASLADRLADAPNATLDDHPVTLVGRQPEAGPFTDRGHWLMVDRSAAGILHSDASPRRLLVAVDGHTLSPSLRASIRSIAGNDAAIDTPGKTAEQLRSNTTIPGLEKALILATVGATALAAAALVMTLVRAGAARRRLFTVVRVLGLTRRQSRALIAWEVGPLAAVALILGILLGIALPYAVLAGVDLRLFTGGTEQPQISVNPLLTALIAAGVLAVVAIATALAIVLLRRVDQAEALRSMED